MRAGLRKEIASYRLGSMLHESATGTIYRGYDRDDDRMVLIAVAHDPDAAAGHTRRMRREALSLFEMRHPNIVSVLDVGALDGLLYVVLEHVDGRAIDAYVREEGLAWRRTLGLFEAAARGLAAAHARAIVHGAVRPACIKVAADERVRVTDFAIARARTSRGERGDPGRAPELERGAPATIYSDQYAFAYALARSLDESRRGSLFGVPRRIRRAIARAMAAEPVERYPSMHELVSQLHLR